jgi:hypothetical protein
MIGGMGQVSFFSYSWNYVPLNQVSQAIQMVSSTLETTTWMISVAYRRTRGTRPEGLVPLLFTPHPHPLTMNSIKML